MSSSDTPPRPLPTDDDKEDLLLSCRFGDLADVQHFLATFDPDQTTLDAIQDEHGNTVLHMVAANGHTDILTLLLPRVSPSLVARPNHVGSTPLHWAAVNRHLDIARHLVLVAAGPGIDLIDAKNNAGRSPLGEAEMTGWDEGARWFAQVMRLDAEMDRNHEQEEEEQEGSADDPSSQAIEVEIQDADGQLAKMSIHPKTSDNQREQSS